MKYLKYSCLFLAGLNAQSAYDVCVIGGGAGGISTAIYAKDAGLSVVILEKENQVGGHCDTYYFNHPTTGTPLSMDIGVIGFPDTIKANRDLDGSQDGRWGDFDMKAFMNRFAPGNITDIDVSSGGRPRMLFDEATHTIVSSTTAPFVNVSDPDVQNALVSHKAIFQQYPWIEYGHPRGPIPDELLVPFSEFIVTKGLTPLVPIFRANIYTGGLGSWNKLTALWALRNISPTDLRMYLTPKSHFVLRNGCQAFYNGAVNYLGASNVLLESTVEKVTRSDDGPIIVRVGHISGGQSTRTLNCGKLVVAFPQMTNDMAFINLDGREKKIFSSVSTYYYFDGTINLSGPIENSPAYRMTHTDSSNDDFMLAEGTTWATVTKSLPIPGVPAAIYSFSDTPISIDQMKESLNNQFTSMATYYPLSPVTGHEIGQFNYHKYYPHPSNKALKKRGPNFFEKVEALQGHKNTYWVGALVSMNSHNAIFLHARDLVNKHFK